MKTEWYQFWAETPGEMSILVFEQISTTVTAAPALSGRVRISSMSTPATAQLATLVFTVRQVRIGNRVLT